MGRARKKPSPKDTCTQLNRRTPKILTVPKLPYSGASVARKFAQKYSVALLARKPSNYESLVNEIEAAGGNAIGIRTDVTDGASVAKAFEKIKAEMNGGPLAAAIYNVGGRFIRKPFLELDEEEFMAGMEANGYAVDSSVPIVSFPADGKVPVGKGASTSPRLFFLYSLRLPMANIPRLSSSPRQRPR